MEGAGPPSPRPRGLTEVRHEAGMEKVGGAGLGLLLVLLGADTLYAESRTCTLPVLMYHHFAQEGNGGTIVSEARFREQMEALKGMALQP